MNVTDTVVSALAKMAMVDRFPEPVPAAFSIRIKELCERDRRSLLMHFLALDSRERQLRFGNALSDESITKYVQKISFLRDAIFGVYDHKLELAGVAHLAYLPREAVPVVTKATRKERVAEFGVSVSAAMRGMGIGTKLFERAVIHCRNADVDTLFVHCLVFNQVMMHIAIKAGMTIHRDHGEADAYLKLQPPSAASVLTEAMQEQAASLDYSIKVNMRGAAKLLRICPD